MKLIGIKVNLTLDRTCKRCRNSESDHPCKAHLLYHLDLNGKEKIYDSYESKEKADNMLNLLETHYGVSAVHNEYKFRYSYEDCQGEF